MKPAPTAFTSWKSLSLRSPIPALRMALERRVPAPGLVHHSDRGVQYALRDYAELLKARDITISMSRRGNPFDNAACESFMKTLKYEEVHRQEYRDLAEARASIEHFLERVYNQNVSTPRSATRRRSSSSSSCGRPGLEAQA